MRTRVSLAVVAAAVATALGMPSAASADYWIKCGDDDQSGAGWFDSKGHNVNCRTVRNVARGWHDYGGNAPPNWRCKFRSRGYELGVVTCRRTKNGERKIVKFKTGS